MISSKPSVECIHTPDKSPLTLGSESNYAVDKCLISGNAQLQKVSQNCRGKVSPTMNGSLKVGSVGVQYDKSLPTLASLNLSYPKQLPVVDELTSSLSLTEVSITEAGNVGHDGLDSEQFEYHRSIKDMHNLSMAKVWPSASHEDVSSISALMGQDMVQQFGIQEGNLDDKSDFMRKRHVSMDQILQLDKLSTTVTTKDKEDLQSYPFSSFTAGPNITMATNEALFLSQTTSAAPACDRTVKPRVRARRGQATDPHSIAERLRREKIAERMKNLQELVPNSSKIDKASMLDEIIEYVKFLQLQVKVLSMSRVGAAGAIIPLITDVQVEGSNSLSLAPSAGLGIDISPSPDQVAFEQEVLKLMESNLTTAIQYLQSKGFCLMPIDLATAISRGKAPLSCNGSEEEQKISFANDLVHSNSISRSRNCSFSGTETHQVSNDDNIMTEQLSKGNISNGCNGMVKREKAKNNFLR
ncbi:hypothetical protein GH714_028647 [Hevea brasiliensis]|uniref:BHLH domain-containing protein n=1 Tax=Hevea brasiliensis TaxID=3981 RepID=A0A6A6LVQ1_HEVBR|nr:hypothetical protein GH714_028647 [Hevea brasiliensis]